jgi:hypothetical protein
MQIALDRDSPLLRTLSEFASPIFVANLAADWPSGLTQADIAVLDWIAAEGRRIGRAYNA